MEHLDRVFGCGINPREFSQKVEVLPKKKRERLERVAERIRLITKLNYESIFMVNPDEDKGDASTFLRWDLASLQVYLYCTCIDTLASKADYIEFERWFRRQDTTNLTVDKVIALQKEYSDKFGNRKSFFDVFRKMPLSLKTWLTQNVAFLEWLEFEDGISEERDADETLDNLAEYLYGVWRNPFTHGAKTYPVESKWDIESLNEYYSNIPSLSYLADSEWTQQPLHFQLNKKSKKWSLWHKKHLDINTILRIIVQCLVYDLLQIDVTHHLIEKNVQHINRHHSLYTFIHILRINREALESWNEIDFTDTSDAMSDLIHRGIPQLVSKPIEKLLIFFQGRNPFERSLVTQVINYKDLLIKINLEIQNFNKNHPRLEKQEREIIDNRKQDIKVFLEGLSQSALSKDLIRSSRQFYDIWWLVRDNFVYDSINLS